MCEDCQERKREYDWVRDGESNPKLSPNGSYVMQESSGAYYGFTIGTLDKVRKLFNEIEIFERRKKNEERIATADKLAAERMKALNSL